MISGEAKKMIFIFLTHPRDLSGVYNRMTTEAQDTPRIKIKAIFKKPNRETPETSELDIEPITRSNMLEPVFMLTPRGTYVCTMIIHLFVLVGLLHTILALLLFYFYY
jgi:hypothetical protein